MIDGIIRNQSPLSRIRGVAGADLHVVEGTVNPPALHRSAEHEMVRAPAVVGAFTVRRERAAEVRRLTFNVKRYKIPA